MAHLEETFVYKQCNSFEDYSKKLEALSPVVKYCEENDVFFGTHHHPYYKTMAVCLSIDQKKLSRCKLVAIRIKKMVDDIMGDVGMTSYISYCKHYKAR